MKIANRPIRAGLVLSLLLTTPVLAVMEATPPDADAIKRGEYIAHLGDCAACHTARGGALMAGGREMNTPFGIIHSTNITPDADTGIGGYSFEQFDRAVREGKAADGRNLYPVMPYPSFAKIEREDMRALYSYLLHGVAPVKQATPKNDMQWPFSMRFGLSFWNLAFVDEHEYKPDPAKSAQWNRGAYIVQGAGHCGSCHTPRGMAFEEKTMDQGGSSGNFYLGGSTIDAWHAPSLRSHAWSAQEISQFLKTGRNSHAAAFGSMAEVVHFSTQRIADEDLAAIAEYLGSLPKMQALSPTRSVPPANPEVFSKELFMTRAGLGYVQFCSACHQLDGRGIADFFPPLADNSSIESEDPSSVIHVVLSGWKSAETQRYPRAFGMPGFSILSDREIAEILSFVRASWGNQGYAVTPEQVRRIRDEIKLKPSEPSEFVTPRFAAMLESPNADQLILGMRIITETKSVLPGHVGASLSCSSCHLNGGTVAKASPFVGISALFPLYAPRAGRNIDFPDRVSACFRRSMNGRPLDKKSDKMMAIVAYFDWMKSSTKPGDPLPGRGVGKISDTFVPDAKNGKRIYQDQCAICHGKNGEGMKRADGTQAFPPLSGDATFTIGAGMARTYTAAGFVKNNMPIAMSLKFPMGQGGLTDQEAVDVAEYFTHMPRPDFPDKVKDWPKGGKPKDARY